MIPTIAQSDEAWNEAKESWGPFRPLVRYGFNGQKKVLQTLSADITDKYYQKYLKHINLSEHGLIHSHIGRDLTEPSFVERIAQVEPIGYRIVGLYNLPLINRKSRQDNQVLAFVQTILLNKENVSEEYLLSSEPEEVGFKLVADQIASSSWFAKLKKIQEEDPACEPHRLFVKMCMEETVPGMVLTGLFFKANCCFSPFVEPLTFFWFSVMTEDFTTDGRNKELLPDDRWLTIEETGLLVVFFMMHAQCLPLIMRSTDLLLPWYITWDEVKAWDAGRPFFTNSFINQILTRMLDGPVYRDTVGSIFGSLLHFYTTTCPFGEGTYNLDSGEFIRHDSDPEGTRKGVLIDTVLDPTTGIDKNANFRKAQKNIMRAMVKHLETTSDDRKVGNDLTNIRRKHMATIKKVEN